MAVSSSARFVELFAKTNYSFLEGASHPEEIMIEAAAQGYAAVGICDRNGVYGIPRAHQAAKVAGIKLVVGSEVRLEDGTHLFLLVRNRQGYANLCQLLTLAHAQRPHEERGLEKIYATWESLEKFKAHLFCALEARAAREKTLVRLTSLFPDSIYLIASQFFDSTAGLSSQAARKWSEKFSLPVVASNLPLFHKADRKPLHDVVTCIRHGCTLETVGYHALPNSERHLKSRDQIEKIFAKNPEWIANTVLLADACQFSMEEIRYRYPMEWIPEGETGFSYLAKLAHAGALKVYGEFIPEEVQKQIAHELELIEELEYADYFLTVWDIVQFARAQGILCQGRGSAANSMVCYVIGITSIDPVRMDLLFERFISRERKEPPDIDIDFEHDRREEVIQYIYKRYGRHRAAITAEVICYRKRSAIREVAKVFSIPLEVIERYLAIAFRRKVAEIPREELDFFLMSISAERLSLFLNASRALQDFPRHLGTHVGGFVLSHEPLNQMVPIENAAMEGRTIIQWDKNDLDALGFVKVDVLGLGILTAIRRSFETIELLHGERLTLASVPGEDPKVYDAICDADTIGVFQIESRAQMSMLPRLKPRNFFDLVVEISIVRPGPIQGEMVHPYLRRRNRQEPIVYDHPDLRSILGKTYGVPLFQEQIMKMGMVVAGFTAGEADELRRAMGTWKNNGHDRLQKIGDRFRKGLMKNGIALEVAERIYHQIEGFAEYGFPESHAASFAILAYTTAWLKLYHPGAFLCSLLNSQPMGFYSPHTLIHDAQRHGVHVYGVDANRSRWDNWLESANDLRLGFRELKGFPERTGRAIEAARGSVLFSSWEDFLHRLQKQLAPVVLTKRELFCLAAAHAFECFGLTRREAFWEIQGRHLADGPYLSPPETRPSLRQEGAWERIAMDYEAHGVSLFCHPMAFLRSSLTLKGILASEEVRRSPDKMRVRTAGMVICRQMPSTANGTVFLSLEDEGGFTNAVVWKDVFERYKLDLMGNSFLQIEGRVQKTENGKVVHVIVESAKALFPERCGKEHETAKFRSHDFR